MKRIILMAALVTMLLGGHVWAAEVNWIDGIGESFPPAWSISPTNPNTGDVITFEGPTDQMYAHSCPAEQAFGGKPYLDINPFTKTIELKFQNPPLYCILPYIPVYGFEGNFGPLSAGNWIFKSTHSKIAFQVNFTVGGGGGGNIIYVDQNGPMTMIPPNGSSWTLAYHNLQDGLAAAQSGDTIHIADGTYTPDVGSGITAGNRSASFEIPDDVHILGGYAGYGAFNPDHRDVDATPTILSGQITVQGPFPIPGITDVSDNSYHVVSSYDSGTLDGVTVTAGNADGFGDNGYGGGVFLKSSTLLIVDCKIRDNRADYGAGVACVEGITPTLLDTEITGNWAHIFGGAVYNNDGNVEMTNCLLTGNTATSADVLGGDAILNVMGSLDVTNCTIADNRPAHGAPANGRAIANLVWGPGFVDTLSFKNNIIRNGGSEIWSTETGIVTLYYNNIEGGIGVYSGVGNIDQNPLFKNPGAWAFGWFFDDDGYTLLLGSPSIDAGIQALIPPGIVNDLKGDARVQGANVDQGAYEGFGLPPLPPAVVAVPNVVGLPQAFAQSAINSAGLVVGFVGQIYHATVPLGQVISQNPTGGSTANVGDAVNLVVSKGPSPLPPAVVLVPNIVGMTQAAAQSAITSAGLVVGTVSEYYHSFIPAGQVMKQNPLGGSTANVGDAVNFQVSKGLPPGGGGGWLLVTTTDILYNVNNSSSNNTVSGSKNSNITVSAPAEYKIEINGLPAVGGTWTATPSTGLIPSGTTNVAFSIFGQNVDFSSLSFGLQKIAEIKWYVRPQ
ncbi:PASTA domain-containing protein [Planctomycetota bacterium]